MEAVQAVERRFMQEANRPISAASILEWLGGAPTATGIAVTPEGGLKNPAIYACVRVISEDLASLPLILHRRTKGGKERAVEHPLYRLLHDAPNPYMSAMVFRETLQAHLLLRGNAYANIERDDVTGRILGLWPLRADRMATPVMSEAGTLLYTYTLPDGEPRALAQSEVLHLRGLSSDGLTGYSPIALHRETVGWSQATRDYSARWFGNNSSPGGLLQKKDGHLSPEAATRLKASWESAHRGLDNVARVAVLEDGLEWVKVQLSPEEAQAIETMKFQIEDAARIYRVPLVLLQSHEKSTSWGTGIEQFMLGYVVHTLRPWLVRWEQECNRALLMEREQPVYFAEHLIDALLRGTTKERYEAYQKAWWMTGNEIRERENLGALDGLDEPLIPQNMLLGTAPAPAPEPTSSGAAA